MNKWSSEDFKGSENILHDTPVVDTCRYVCQNLQNVLCQGRTLVLAMSSE